MQEASYVNSLLKLFYSVAKKNSKEVSVSFQAAEHNACGRLRFL